MTDRREDIADTLREGKTFSCHKTVHYTDDGPDSSDAVQCFGAAASLHQSGLRPMQAQQIAERLRLVEPRDPAALDAAEVLTLDEWVAGR